LSAAQWREYKIILGIILFAACAHKAPPLFKDRLKPRLQKIQALNNRQVQFIFSEKLLVTKLDRGNFTIRADQDTLNIITVYPSTSAWEIIALTEPQQEINYEVSGYVYDEAENTGIFKTQFTGNPKPDTIPPSLTHQSQGKKFSSFTLVFSEAMDTSFIEYRIIPKKALTAQWRDYRTCEIIPIAADSLRMDTTYYLDLEKGARDISGNYLSPFITQITPDSVYEPLILKGTVVVDGALVRSGRAVLKRGITLGIALIEAGGFRFEVRDSLPYMVEVVSGQYWGSLETSVAREDTIFLKREEHNIDSIID
jgi:hypothetical protein